MRSVGNLDQKPVGNLGQNARAARKKRNLSQEAVAERAGLQAGEVSRIEANKRDPQVSTLIRLAAALEVPPGWLLEEGDDVPPSGET